MNPLTLVQYSTSTNTIKTTKLTNSTTKSTTTIQNKNIDKEGRYHNSNSYTSPDVIG